MRDEGVWLRGWRHSSCMLFMPMLGILSIAVTAAPIRAQDTACVPLMIAVRTNPNVAPTLRDCAFNIDNGRRKVTLGAINPTIKRLADLPWFIPEYHDEQRLADGAGKLGPMAHIFASPYLSTITSLAQIVEHEKLGVLVALVQVDKENDVAVPPTYQELNLRYGMNCIYLAYDSSAPPKTRWTANVLHPATETDACARDLPVTGPRLFVHRIVTGPDSAFPPVTRFTESTAGKPILGFKCLNGWCEAGPPAGFSPRNPLTAENKMQAHIKAWHDEQILTDRVGTQYVPSGVRAIVIPEPGIAKLDSSHFGAGWQRVATIELTADPPTTSKYYRWGLRNGKNYLEISAVTGTWKARLQHDTGPAKDWPIVERMKHYDAGVPGTARWRWTILDDGIWVPCGQACCQAEGPLT